MSNSFKGFGMRVVMKLRPAMVCLVVAMGLSLCLSGCLGPVDLPAQKTYTISDLHPKSIRHYPSKTKLTLLVSLPVASSGYTSSKMMYLSLPYELKAFADNRWIAPPARLLLPLFADALRRQHYFHAVVVSPFSGSADLTLKTDLVILRQEFLKPMSQVRLVVSASLINNETHAVVASRQFQALINAPGNDPYSGVLATNKAAASVARSLAKFVVKHTRS